MAVDEISREVVTGFEWLDSVKSEIVESSPAVMGGGARAAWDAGSCSACRRLGEERHVAARNRGRA